MESAKKRTLTHDSAHFFQFFSTLIVFFNHFKSLGGLLGAFGGLGSLVGTFWGPNEWLNLLSYPHHGSNATVSSIGQIRGFLESAKSIVPKPKVMEDRNRAKMKKSVNVFVS